MTVLVVALAIVLRVAWVLVVPSKPVGDFAMYVESAAHLVEHGALDPEYVYMPGYVLLIAPVRALGGGWLATKLVGAVLGGLGAGAVAGIARRLCGGSSRAALASGLLYAFWPAGIAIASVTGTDMPAAVLILFAWYALVRLSADRPVLAGLLCGLLTGLAAYIRAIVVPLAALSVLVFRAQRHPWRVSMKSAAVTCAVALLTLAPWAIRNRLRYGETFFTDSHGGLTALVGANPNTDGCYSRSLNRMFHDVTGFVLLAEPHRAADRAALAIAKDWIRFDPPFALGLLASKAERLLAHERSLLYWPLFRAGVLSEPERTFFDHRRSALEALADDFYLSLLALALMGIALAALRRNWLALSLLPEAGALAALYTAIFAESRYRLPIFMLLIPFAALALKWLAEAGRGLLRRAPPMSWKREGLLAAGFAAAVFVTAQSLAWAGARLREQRRWAVHECQVAGRPQFCKWKTTGVEGDLHEAPSLRGTWNGVGLAIPRTTTSTSGSLSAETDLVLDPGDYTVAFSVDLTPPDSQDLDADGTIVVAANARSLGEPIALRTVAVATREGKALLWKADLHHHGGPFRLQVRATMFPGDRPQSARLWVGDLRVLRNALLGRREFRRPALEVRVARREDGLPAAAATATAPAVVAVLATTAATTTTTTTESAATAARCTLARLADVDWPALDLATVQGLDGLGGFCIGRHLDESKSAWTPGIPVEHNLDLFHVAPVLGEYILQFRFRHVVRQIAYIEPRSHYFLLMRLTSLSLVPGPWACERSRGDGMSPMNA